MAIKGSLKEASLADVCQLLAMGQKTGCLSVTDQSRFGQIFFDRGRITFATIVNRRDRLGDLLVRDGVVSRDDLEEAIDQQAREPDRRLGEILLSRDLIDSDRLREFIQLQIEEAVYYLFTWKQGSFFFEAGQEPDEGEILITLNPESLLLEGARRIDEWSVIEKKIPSLDLIFEVDQERVLGADVELTEAQRTILPYLDGTRSVLDLSEETGLAEFDTGQALYGLLQAGFANRVGQRGTGEERVRETDIEEARNLGIAFYRTGMLEDAAREFRRVLAEQPTDTAARTYLALVFIRQGRHADAVQRLRTVLEETGPEFSTLVNLAYALSRMDRSQDAQLVLEEAESRSPERPEPALARAALCLEDRDAAGAAEALAEYRTRLDPGATPPAAYYHTAVLTAVLLERHEDAAGLAREGLDAHPASPPLLLLAGSLAERRGDAAEAARCYRQAAEEDPKLPQAYKSQGDIAYRRGLHDDALEHYQRAIELAPKLGDDVLTKLGNIHYKRMERDVAVEYWRRALELNPENEIVRNNLDVVEHAGQ